MYKAKDIALHDYYKDMMVSGKQKWIDHPFSLVGKP